ncbi:hypothetical protein FFLO_02169 [Filobasidium floriforme]|uniref:Uncharacterized protein n=1 Tax=Filobasidium floriforme TaxID=5210 RepID=A0A8K0JNI4_9TREE|nr:uncharacterized protein HD553DRAFT_176835 [Filobasidium floriforme]KAG7562389.1 hypothetical protein FFLO_02169 [Filobasidium floriforme]KAH8088438.1 hypothetical protein HD553DRAFT_176835 [Filobasidium floriforme]
MLPGHCSQRNGQRRTGRRKVPIYKAFCFALTAFRQYMFDLADQAVRFWVAFIRLNVAALLSIQVRPLVNRLTEYQNSCKRY